MADSDWTLCARYSGPNPLDWYLVQRDTPLKREWVYSCVPGQLPTFVGSSVINPDHPHFPWDEDVDPD